MKMKCFHYQQSFTLIIDLKFSFQCYNSCIFYIPVSINKVYLFDKGICIWVPSPYYFRPDFGFQLHSSALSHNFYFSVLAFVNNAAFHCYDFLFWEKKTKERHVVYFISCLLGEIFSLRWLELKYMNEKIYISGAGT